MREARAQMIACPIQKNLGLVFHPSKRARMDNARAVALKFRAIGMARLGVFAAARFARFFGKLREYGALGCLHFFARFAVRDAHDK
jgi:hypothetical protein